MVLATGGIVGVTPGTTAQVLKPEPGSKDSGSATGGGRTVARTFATLN